MRVIVSLSPPTPENPFSISSIQRMQGAAASAIRMAFRRFASLSPTYLPIMLPISSFKSGDSNRAAEALAHKDFPQPGIPTINTPLGMATPYLRASAICLITCALLVRYFFSASIPPMLFKFSGVSINSNRPDFFTICFFCRRIISVSSALKEPLLLIAISSIRSISKAVMPLSEGISFSRSSSLNLFLS